MAKRNIHIFEEGDWIPGEMKDIKKGDRFRMFEVTGQAVLNKDGGPDFVASSNAFMKVVGEFKDWAVENE